MHGPYLDPDSNKLRKNKPVMEMSALSWEVRTKELLFIILDVIMVLQLLSCILSFRDS